jgi:hypothetical protein
MWSNKAKILLSFQFDNKTNEKDNNYIDLNIYIHIKPLVNFSGQFYVKYDKFLAFVLVPSLNL